MRPTLGQLEHSTEEVSGKAAGMAPEIAKELSRRISVGEGTVWMGVRQAQLAREVRQAVAGRHRQHDPGEVERVEELIAPITSAVDQEGQVEVATVCDHAAVADEIDQLGEYLLWRWRRRDIGIPDPGQLLDRPRDRNLRPDERLERRQHLIAVKADGADLDDSVQSWRQASGLEIEGDQHAVHQGFLYCKMRISVAIGPSKSDRRNQFRPRRP